MEDGVHLRDERRKLITRNLLNHFMHAAECCIYLLPRNALRNFSMDLIINR
jgi:hypothetical protein